MTNQNIDISNFITQNPNDLIAYKAPHPFDKLTIITDQSCNKNYFFATEVYKILGYSSSNAIGRTRFIKENRKLLSLNFLIQIKNLKSNIKLPTRGLLLFNEIGLLQIILNTTKLVKHLKIKLIEDLKISKLIDIKFLQYLIDNNIVDNENNELRISCRKETEFFGLLKNILIPFNIEIKLQMYINQYKVDCYIPKLNIIIEYDEQKNHISYNKDSEKKRELVIKNKLGCNIIRVSDEYNHGINCGKVMKELIKYLN